jgi:beta-mannanase
MFRSNNNSLHSINPKMTVILVTGFLILYLSMNSHSVSSYAASSSNSQPSISDVKLIPPLGGIYHGAFTDFGGEENEVTARKIIDFENIAGKKMVWAYFSNNWGSEGIVFPEAKVKTIHSLGIVPFIRMMPRTTFDQGRIDPNFTLQGIINGNFDNELRRWADDAKRVGIPIMVEFGTEVNGDWFPWSGALNGEGKTKGYGDPNYPDGPERFRDAYRHIIDLFRKEGARNITWSFHVAPSQETGSKATLESWNNIKNYYPGDEYIDWIGASIYGADTPNTKWKSFTNMVDKAYPELTAVSARKPIAIFEFGVIEDPQHGNKTEWIKNALQSVEGGNRYPRIKAISYWDDKWRDDNTSKTIDLRVNSSAMNVDAYRTIINSSFFVSQPQFSKTNSLTALGMSGIMNMAMTDAPVKRTKMSNLTIGNAVFPIHYSITGEGNKLINLSVKTISSLRVNIDSQSDGRLTIELPRKIIDSKMQGGIQDFPYQVLENGAYIQAQEMENNTELRTQAVDFVKGAGSIEIHGGQTLTSVISAYSTFYKMGCDDVQNDSRYDFRAHEPFTLTSSKDVSKSWIKGYDDGYSTCGSHPISAKMNP